MNIVHVTPYFYPTIHFGGTPEAVFSLVQAQSRLGNHITILTTDAGLDEPQNTDEITFQKNKNSSIRAIGHLDSLQIVYLKNRYPNIARKWKLFTADFSHPETIKQLPEPLHIIHFHEVNISGYRSLAQWASSKNIPHAVSTHGSYKPPIHTPWKKIMHGILDPYWQWNWFQNNAAYFLTSKVEVNQLIANHIPKELIHHIPLGQPYLEKQSTELPFEFAANTGIPTLLYLGRINEQKGIELAYRAFELMWQEQHFARLVLCGPDEGGVSSLQRLNKKPKIPLFYQKGVLKEPGIYTCPPIARSQLQALFNKVDLTLCPSPYESFGLTLVESLQCGTPAVATKQYGCLDFLPHPIPGLACIANPSPKSFKQAIVDMLERSSTAQEPTQPLLPSWEEIAQKMLNIYRHNQSSSR